MPLTSPELDAEAAHVAMAAKSLGIDEASGSSRGEEALVDGLAPEREERRDLRRAVDKLELRLALRDLTEGVRGLIRVTPLTAVFAATLLGMALARRRRRPPLRRA
jgi:hypothetical protein